MRQPLSALGPAVGVVLARGPVQLLKELAPLLLVLLPDLPLHAVPKLAIAVRHPQSVYGLQVHHGDVLYLREIDVLTRLRHATPCSEITPN